MNTELYTASKNLGYTGSDSDSNAWNTWRESLNQYDKSYITSLSQGQGEPNWWKLYQEAQTYKDSNPYIYNQMMGAIDNYLNQKFAPTFSQQVWNEPLGDYSARQNFANENFANLSSSFEKIRESLHTEDYTNPSAQVERERSAGLNPDLNGGSSLSSGEPGNIDQADITPSVVNPGESDIVTIAQGVSNVFNSVISFISNIKSFQLQNIQLATNELNELTTADNWFNQMLKRTIRYNFAENGSSDSNSPAWSKALQDAFTSISESDEFNRLNRHTRKAVKTIISNYDVDNISSKALYEELKNEYLSSRAKNVEIESSRNFSTSLAKWIENSQPYFEEFYKAQMKHFEAQQKEPRKVEAEISSLNASARSANASAEMTEYRKSKIENIGSLFDGIKSAIPKDAWYKGLAEWFTEISRIMTIQALVSE